MTTVVIVTFNAADVVGQSLDSLAGQKTIVVDSASTDATLDIVKRFPFTELIPLDENRGFSAAANVGIRAAASDDVFLMNPDAYVSPAAIRRLERWLAGEPGFGLVAPELFFPDGGRQASARTFPSPLTMALRRTPLGRSSLGRSKLAQHLMPPRSAGLSPVDWVIGAAMLLRRQALKHVGLFDERFFLYGEDVDLCHRLWAAGWAVGLASDVRATHDYARQSAQTLDLRSAATRHHWASTLKLYAKHPGLIVGRSPRREVRGQ